MLAKSKGGEIPASQSSRGLLWDSPSIQLTDPAVKLAERRKLGAAEMIGRLKTIVKHEAEYARKIRPTAAQQSADSVFKHH